MRALLIGTALACSAAGPARAQQASAQAGNARAFTIPAQPLTTAVTAFGDQAGLQVTVDGAILSGLSSQAVVGRYSPAEALSRLLAGTGITYRWVDGRSIALERAPVAANGAIHLGAVQVAGENGSGSGPASIAASLTSDPNATEGTGSYTTRAMTSATRLDLSPRQTPQSVTVITRERMDRENIKDVEDVVAATPGLSVIRGDARPAFYSRGFAIDRLTQNGISTSFDSYVPSSLGNMAMNDRIEVVRGASGLLQGSGNPSAAINMFRKMPTRSFQVLGNVSAGSWNDYSGMVDIGGPLDSGGKLRARAVGYVRDADTFRSGERATSKMFYATIEGDLTDSTTINIGYSWFKSHGNIVWGGLPLNADGTHLNVPRSTFVAANWEYMNQLSQSVYGQVRQDFGGGWSALLNAVYTDAKSSLLGTWLMNDTVNGGYGHVWWAGDRHRRQKAADLYVTGPFKLLGRTHQLVVGGTISRETSRDRSWFDSWSSLITHGLDLTTWDHTAPLPVLSDKAPSQGDYSNQDDIYATARFSLADPLTLIVGLRGDWLNRTSWGERQEVHGHLTKYGGLVLDLNKTYSAYVSYTDIFQAQSNRDVNLKFLAPIIGQNYELGVKGAWFNGGLNASAALFRMDSVNRARLLLDQGGCPTYPADSCYEASGLVRSQGVDMELDGALARNWQIGAGFTWSRAEYRKDNNASRIGQLLSTAVPTTQLKVSTNYTLPGKLDRFNIGGRVIWQSEIYYDVELANESTVSNAQKGYAVVDLMAGFKPVDWLSVQLAVNNLFDKTYYTAISSGGDYGAEEIFGKPRNVMVTLRAKY